MNLTKTEYEDVYWVYVAQDQTGSSEHSNEHSGSIKGREFLTCCVTISFSRRTLPHEVGSVSYISEVL
jgi:hypothetical protein